MAAHLVEGLHLHSANEGYQRVGQWLQRLRQKAYDQQQHHFAQQNDLPPVELLGVFQPDMDAFRCGGPDQKGHDRNEVF